jgi:hypothetical protein
MPRFSLKALFAALSINRAKKTRLDRDTAILIFEVLLTLGLVVFYVLSRIGFW